MNIDILLSMVSTCLLLTVIESVIMNTIVDVIMPGETERERREKEGRGVHYTEWPIATGRLYKTNNIGKINIEGKNRNTKD